MRLRGGIILATIPSGYLTSPTPGLDAQEDFVELLRTTMVVQSRAASRGVPSDARDAHAWKVPAGRRASRALGRNR